MPSVRHHESQKGAHPSVLGAGSVPVTQDSLELNGNQLWEQVLALENTLASTQGSVITFQIPASTDAMTSIGETYVEVQGYFLKAAAVDYQDSLSVTTSPMLAAMLFRDVTLEINGTTVVPSQGLNQPYCTVASMIKNRPYTDRITEDITECLILDSAGSGATWNQDFDPLPVTPDDGTAVVNTVINNIFKRFPQYLQLYTSGEYRRRQIYLEGAAGQPASAARAFSLKLRLADLGFDTRGAWLPPNTTMRLRMVRSSDNALVRGMPAQIAALGGGALTAPPFTISGQGIRAFVARKTLKPHVLQELTAAQIERPLKVPYEQIRATATFFAAGVQNMTVVGALSGPTPKCVYAFTMRADTLNQTIPGGGVWSPAMALAPAQNVYWNNVTLSLGGSRTYPVHPFSQSPGVFTRNFPNNNWLSGGAADLSTNAGALDLAQIYEMYRTTCNPLPFLKAEDFTNIQPLCFQITHDSIDGWDEAEDVSLQFKGNFTGDPGYTYVLLLVSFTDGIIEIRATGETSVV